MFCEKGNMINIYINFYLYDINVFINNTFIYLYVYQNMNQNTGN